MAWCARVRIALLHVYIIIYWTTGSSRGSSKQSLVSTTKAHRRRHYPLLDPFAYSENIDLTLEGSINGSEDEGASDTTTVQGSQVDPDLTVDDAVVDEDFYKFLVRLGRICC